MLPVQVHCHLWPSTCSQQTWAIPDAYLPGSRRNLASVRKYLNSLRWLSNPSLPPKPVPGWPADHIGGPINQVWLFQGGNCRQEVPVCLPVYCLQRFRKALPLKTYIRQLNKVPTHDLDFCQPGVRHLRIFLLADHGSAVSYTHLRAHETVLDLV